MNQLFNTSQKIVVVKDMTGILNFTEINKKFNELKFKNNVSNFISEETNFFDKGIFDSDKKIIIEDCEQYLIHTVNIGPLFEKLRITNSWGNITEPGSSHHEHHHPFSIVSGIIYLDENPSNLNLFIESYIPQVPYFVSQNKSFISLHSLLNEAKINPMDHKFLKNHMILFLSNFNHFVDKVDLFLPKRRSISFNTFWSGLTGIKNDTLGSIKF